jgi:hypothetical protein
MRRRLALLLLPLAIAVWLLRPHAPTERALQVHLGPHAAELREAELVFQRADSTEHSVARDLTLRFPSGAPADDARRLRLAAGHYEVGVRLVYASGREAHLTRTVDASGDDPVDLDLR